MTAAAASPLRCAIYVRFSSDMQSPLSCDDQLRECTGYADREGWKVVLVERDEAVRAAAIAERHGYMRLMNAAKAGKFDILLVEETSRFSRDFWEGLKEVGELRKLGVQLADTKTGLINPDDPMHQLRFAFGMSNNQQETKRLGERSKRGLKGKVLQKFSAGGQPPYGYRRVPVFSEHELDADGRARRVGVRFEPDPIEGPVALRVFQLYADGVSKHGIAVRFNKDGIPTRRAGEMRAGAPVSGAWTAATVKGILENPMYTGTLYWNQTSRSGEKHPHSGKKGQRPNERKDWVEVPGFVTPLVSPELWQAVQARLKKDAAEFKRQHVTNGTRRYLLSGFLRCADCGSHYAIGAHRGVPPTPHYRCAFRAARGASTCSNKTVVSQLAIEARVKELLEVIVKDPKRLAALVVEHNSRIGDANEGQLSTVRALQARKQTLETERGRLVGAIVAGTGPAKTLAAEVEKRDAELEEVTARIADAEARMLPVLVPSIVRVTDFMTGNAPLFNGDFDADRKFLEHVVDKVLVYESGAIVVQFRHAGLFEPIGFATFGQTSPGDLAAKRRGHLHEFQQGKEAVAQQAGAAAESLAVDVLHDKNGSPAYIMFTPGSVKRTFGPGKYAESVTNASSPTSGEVALASPGGIAEHGGCADHKHFEGLRRAEEPIPGRRRAVTNGVPANACGGEPRRGRSNPGRSAAPAAATRRQRLSPARSG